MCSALFTRAPVLGLCLCVYVNTDRVQLERSEVSTLPSLRTGGDEGV